MRQDQVQPPLSRPYRGPYRVLDRQQDYFILEINGTPDSVSITRLKPAITTDEFLGQERRIEPPMTSFDVPSPSTPQSQPPSETTGPRPTRSGRVPKVPKKYQN